ncbi:MAG: DMT family transporter [Gemmatimonadaceae bacterium]
MTRVRDVAAPRVRDDRPRAAPEAAGGGNASPGRPALLPLVLALAVLGISASGPLARLAASPPLVIAFWRLTFALICIAGMLAVTGEWRTYRTLARRDLGWAAASGAMLALHFWSWIASLDRTSVAASVVLVNLHPLVIVLGSALLLGERAGRTSLAGLALAMVGGAVVAYGDSGAGGGVDGAMIGDLLAVLGAVTVGGYYLVGRHLRAHLPLWAYVGLVYGACWLSVLGLAWATGTPLAPVAGADWVLFAAIAVGPMLLGHTGFNWALRYVPAYVVSLVILLEPVGATLLAALLPSIAEQPSAWTLVGGATILAGLSVGIVGGRR